MVGVSIQSTAPCCSQKKGLVDQAPLHWWRVPPKRNHRTTKRGEAETCCKGGARMRFNRASTLEIRLELKKANPVRILEKSGTHKTDFKLAFPGNGFGGEVAACIASISKPCTPCV